MKTHALLLVLLLSAWHMPAKASILDDVKARITIQNSQRGDFSQEKHIVKLSKPLVATGHFIYLPERGLLWSIEKPYASDTLISQKMLVQSVKGKVIMKTDAAAQPGYTAISRIFMALISTDLSLLEKDFRITGTTNGPNWQLVLTPKNALFASFSKHITLSGGSSLQAISIAEKNGDSTQYRFKNIQAAGNLSAAEITQFDLH